MLRLTLGDTTDRSPGPTLSEGRRGDEETVSSAAAKIDGVVTGVFFFLPFSPSFPHPG